MKKNLYWTMGLCAVSLCAACTGENNGPAGDTLSHIELSFTEQAVKMSRVVEEISYIPLETNETCLIGQVDKLIPTDSFLVVADLETARSVFLFAPDGAFVRKIGRLGPGPEEYSSITDIAVDEEGKRIFVLDGFRIVSYGFDGSFIHSYRSEVLLREIVYAGGDRLACHMGHGQTRSMEKDGMIPTVALFDLKTGVLSAPGVYADKDISSMSLMEPLSSFQRDGTQVRYLTALNDTLYAVIPGERCVPQYVFDLGEGHRQAQEAYIDHIRRTQISAMQVDDVMKGHGLSLVGQALISGDNLMTLFTDLNRWNIGFSDLKTGKSLCGAKTGAGYLENDMDGLAVFLPTAFQDGVVYSPLPAYYIKSVDGGKLSPAAREFQRGVSEESNPVVALFRMKDFSDL